jgi:dihydrofolate reductase
MRKIVVFNNLTLDGVMQGPGRPDEDTRGGFQHGGWAFSRMDSVMGEVAAEGMARQPDLLFGRRTYEDFFSFWPKQADNPFTAVLNNARKYVASTTLKDPLPWSNSILLKGDAGEAVVRLKEEPGQDLLIMGSGELIKSLMRRNVIDQYVLQIHPLILGSGRRLFPGGDAVTALRLVDTRISTTGVIIATYEPHSPRPRRSIRREGAHPETSRVTEAPRT